MPANLIFIWKSKAIQVTILRSTISNKISNRSFEKNINNYQTLTQKLNDFRIQICYLKTIEQRQREKAVDLERKKEINRWIRVYLEQGERRRRRKKWSRGGSFFIFIMTSRDGSLFFFFFFGESRDGSWRLISGTEKLLKC